MDMMGSDPSSSSGDRQRTARFVGIVDREGLGSSGGNRLMEGMDVTEFSQSGDIIIKLQGGRPGGAWLSVFSTEHTQCRTIHLVPGAIRASNG